MDGNRKSCRYEIRGVYRQARGWFPALAFQGGWLQHQRDTISPRCVRRAGGGSPQQRDRPGLVFLSHGLARQLQPGLLINNRLEMGSHEEWVNQGRLRPNEDFYTPEQRIGAYDDQNPWETCMTFGTQWSWKPDDQIKTSAEVICILARTAGGNGNLLLDVGPMPDGRVEPRQVEVLKQVGVWLRRYGESIYGTRCGPWKPTKT